MNTKTIDSKNNFLKSIIKGALISISFTLIMILIFALIIRFFNINDKFIFPINQVIKIISLFVGIMASIKIDNKKGFVKGMILALTYFILSFVIFSILQGAISIKLNNFFDLILTTLMGGIIGIILVNLKK